MLRLRIGTRCWVDIGSWTWSDCELANLFLAHKSLNSGSKCTNLISAFLLNHCLEALDLVRVVVPRPWGAHRLSLVLVLNYLAFIDLIEAIRTR